MKFVVAFVAPAVALRVSHPTVNMVLTNDGAMDASQFSLAQKSNAQNLRGELADLIKSESSHASLAEVSGDFHQPNVVRINYEAGHASLAEVSGDFHQPNVVRINYEAGHAMLAQNIVRESVADGAAYEDGEIGLNLIPAGAGSAASLKQLMDKTDADFETEFRAGLHKSFLESSAIRIRLPRGGLKEGDKLLSDDGVRFVIQFIQVRLSNKMFSVNKSFTNADSLHLMLI